MLFPVNQSGCPSLLSKTFTSDDRHGIGQCDGVRTGGGRRVRQRAGRGHRERSDGLADRRGRLLHRRRQPARQQSQQQQQSSRILRVRRLFCRANAAEQMQLCLRGTTMTIS